MFFVRIIRAPNTFWQLFLCKFSNLFDMKEDAWVLVNVLSVQVLKGPMVQTTAGLWVTLRTKHLISYCPCQTSWNEICTRRNAEVHFHHWLMFWAHEFEFWKGLWFKPQHWVTLWTRHLTLQYFIRPGENQMSTSRNEGGTLSIDWHLNEEPEKFCSHYWNWY